MMLGPVLISFAYPLFIYTGVLLAVALWHWKRRSNKSFIPHSHGIITGGNPVRSLRTAQVAIALASVSSAVILLFATLNPRIVETSTVSYDARKILLVFDISGSMTIGFDDESSPLPSYEKTRMGRAGIFIREFVEKRKGDMFGIAFFDRSQYISRDFTADTSQVTEVLAPVNLVGILNLEQKNIPESIRLKERAEHTGTFAISGLEFAAKFILNHKDYNGKEIMVYIGDIERESGGIAKEVALKLEEIKKEHLIKGYAVLIVTDYMTDSEAKVAKIAAQKTEVFRGTTIPFYKIDDVRGIEGMATRIAEDIPLSRTEEHVVVKKSLAPWALLAGFALMCFALILNEKFPRIP